MRRVAVLLAMIAGLFAQPVFAEGMQCPDGGQHTVDAMSARVANNAVSFTCTKCQQSCIGPLEILKELDLHVHPES